MLKRNYETLKLGMQSAFLSAARKIIFNLVKIDRNNIVFDHFDGLDVGCNPGYIAKEVSKKHPNLRVIWLLSKKYTGGNGHWLTYTGTGFLEKSFALASAKVVVFNTLNSMSGWPKKKGQIWIQTGHGSFGIKKIGMDADNGRRKLIRNEARKTNIFLSNSKFETKVFMSGFLFKRRQVIELGHARNDIFFDERMRSIAKEDIFRRYHLQGKKIVMFAPTHGKGDVAFINKIPVNAVLGALQAKFGGEWVLGMRMHPRTRSKMTKRNLALKIMKSPNVVDLSFHSDMQELLVSSDAVITDYSSGIFDFLLAKKPCFFHLGKQTQIALRKSIYFGFHTTPIPVSSDSQELIENIEKFDLDSFRCEVDTFLERAGSVESGNAAENAADLIKNAALGMSVSQLQALRKGERNTCLTETAVVSEREHDPKRAHIAASDGDLGEIRSQAVISITQS